VLRINVWPVGDRLLAPPRSQRSGQGHRSPHPKAGPGYYCIASVFILCLVYGYGRRGMSRSEVNWKIETEADIHFSLKFEGLSSSPSFCWYWVQLLNSRTTSIRVGARCREDAGGIREETDFTC
jgi:hypothetical protein